MKKERSYLPKELLSTKCFIFKIYCSLPLTRQINYLCRWYIFSHIQCSWTELGVVYVCNNVILSYWNGLILLNLPNILDGSLKCLNWSRCVVVIHTLYFCFPSNPSSNCIYRSLKLRMEGYHWSAPFTIGSEGLMSIWLRSEQGSEHMNLSVEVRGGAKTCRYEVILRPCSFSSPYRWFSNLTSLNQLHLLTSNTSLLRYFLSFFFYPKLSANQFSYEH